MLCVHSFILIFAFVKISGSYGNRIHHCKVVNVLFMGHLMLSSALI
jgi:hypothetical protein